jgi:hypothetical protein
LAAIESGLPRKADEEMDRHQRTTGLVFAMAIVIVASATSPALAQAGSTGGVIGHRNKSISGAEPGNRAHTHSTKKSATRCKLAGTWRNQAPAGNSTWTITADGTATEEGMGSAQGHAKLTGHELVINWHAPLASGRYVIELNQNCSGGTGKVIIGFYSGPAIFTAAPSQSN